MHVFQEPSSRYASRVNSSHQRRYTHGYCSSSSMLAKHLVVRQSDAKYAEFRKGIRGNPLSVPLRLLRAAN